MDQDRRDPFRDLAASTRSLYERFGVSPELQGCITNFNEEVYELVQAALDGTSQQHTAEECADVIVTVIGVCLASGIDEEQIIDQIYAVIAKNNSKTHETHIYKDGKIRRRAPISR